MITAGIDAIDVPYLDLDDPEGMKEEAIKAKQLGFSGKGSIHPKQIPILNKVAVFFLLKVQPSLFSLDTVTLRVMMKVTKVCQFP